MKTCYTMCLVYYKNFTNRTIDLFCLRYHAILSDFCMLPLKPVINNFG